MSTHIKEEVLQLVAGEDLRGTVGKVITLAGTIAASPRTAAGVHKGSVSSGQHTGAVYEGVTKGYFGGAVSTPGWPLTVAASGWLTAAGSGNSTIGRAIGAVASGEVAMFMADFKNLGYNPG